MPRVTRAALRSQELQEDLASVPLPSTPIKSRAPLDEIAGNTIGELETVNTSEDNMVAAKTGHAKGKKGNATKKGVKQRKAKPEDQTVKVLEDDNQSQSSSAAEEACKDLLMKETSGTLSYPALLHIDGPG